MMRSLTPSLVALGLGASSLLTACADDDHADTVPAITSRRVTPRTETPPEPARATARISFTETSHDFGKLTDGDPRTHQFEFENTGDTTLVISDVTASCGCTVPRLAKDEYEPGERGFLEVTYEPKGRGVQSKRLAVHSNATATPVALHISADVSPFAWPTPSRVDFGSVRQGHTPSFDVSISTPDPNTSIEQVASASPFVDVRLAPDDEQPKRYSTWEKKLRFTLAPGAPWGPLFATTEIRFRGIPVGAEEAKLHDLEIVVHASVHGQITAMPDYLPVAVVAPGASFRKELLLLSAPSARFEVIEVRAESSNELQATVEVEPYEDPSRHGYRLTLAGETGSYLGRIHGFVVITTDVPGEETLRVEYAGMVREP